MICGGEGLRGWPGKQRPCPCVFRGVFRVCYQRFVHCVNQEKYVNKVRLHTCGVTVGRRAYERAVEDYIADFTLVARRSLDEYHYRIFRYHYLLGADFRLCCARLDLKRGEFFNAVYAIQHKLGLVYSSLKPYALYPLADYFAGRVNVDDERGVDDPAIDAAAEQWQDDIDLEILAPDPPKPKPKRRALIHPLRRKVA